MGELDDLRGEVATLRARLARLEAKEACLAAFNRYLYLMDVGYPDELVAEVFTPDAVLDVINFPPGTMKDLHFVGHADIAPLYVAHTVTEPSVQGGHHSSNIGVDVAADCSSAELSAYFMTSGNSATLQGGMYQGRLVPDADGSGRWRFRHYQILSGWGWKAPKGDGYRITENLPAERAWRGGRPAMFDPAAP